MPIGKMIKILFLIHDLGRGGAEKVLVNLVNNMDSSQFDITVMVLFGGGVNEQFLLPHIKLHRVFPRMIPGNSHWMKLFTPKQLHSLLIKKHYDIEVSYLEGPSARIISGCEDPRIKTVTWIHSNQFSTKGISASFRNYREAKRCYLSFDKIVCVSKFMRENFCRWIPAEDKCTVLYNTVNAEKIQVESKEPICELGNENTVKLITVGTMKKVKGFDRLLRVVKRLYEEQYAFQLFFLGTGPQEEELFSTVKEYGLDSVVSFLGYQTNPYKYVAKCDLFVCSSYSEGFSTAATEALIVGTPVCTVEVSGMKEMLGENNEFGVVTENSEEALYEGIKRLLDDPGLLKHYREQARIRGESFNTKNTVKALEDMLTGVIKG